MFKLDLLDGDFVKLFNNINGFDPIELTSYLKRCKLPLLWSYLKLFKLDCRNFAALSAKINSTQNSLNE